MAYYLVTGGCGFIGSHLVDKLIERGDKVVVIDDLSTGKIENLPPKAELIKGDINDQKLVSEVMSRVDGCFHLAAIVSVTQSKEDWCGTHYVNLDGTIKIFNAASQVSQQTNKIIPVVYASSCAVYGDSEQLPLHENVRLQPISAYGADKAGCELHGRVATLIHEVPTIGLRLFNVYGSRQDSSSPYSGVISRFVHQAKNALPLKIFGNGQQTRDFIYVADVVQHFVYFMDKMQSTIPKNFVPGIYNVCTGTSVSLLDLVKVLEEKIHTQLPVEFYESRPGDVLHSVGNPKKAIDLGITAKTDLATGLKSLL